MTGTRGRCVEVAGGLGDKYTDSRVVFNANGAMHDKRHPERESCKGEEE
jgi:hypothetical protein